MMSLGRQVRPRSAYLRFAQETGLTRWRTIAFYLHASHQSPYLCYLLSSIVLVISLIGYKVIFEPHNMLIKAPSPQVKPLTDESRTVRGYYRLHIAHQVKAGDTFHKLALRYYGDLRDVFVRHHGEGKPPWQVIQEANTRPDKSLIDPSDIPVAVELKIPLP